MEMYHDFLNRKFSYGGEKDVPTDEVLQYCKLHNIKVLPLVLRNRSEKRIKREYEKVSSYGCLIRDLELNQNITDYVMELSMAFASKWESEHGL